MLVGHSRKLGSKMRTPAVLKAADNVSARELKLYIENDGQLNRQQEVPIQKNLVNKLASGAFDKDKAAKLYGFLVESGAKKYNQEFGDGVASLKLFDKATRMVVARSLANDFLVEANLGNYDHLLNKKNKNAVWAGKR